MTDADPSLPEVMREVQRLVKQVESLVEEVRKDYVRKEFYNEARRADRERIAEVEKDIDAQASFRRQVAAGALIGLLLLLANIVATLARIPGAGS